MELINSKASLAVAACIKSANAVFDKSKDGYKTEIDAFGDCFITDDMQEGVQAFLEQRKAAFKGK